MNDLTQNEQDQINSWINGVTYEVNFWNLALNEKRQKYIINSFKNKTQFNLPFISYEEMGINLNDTKSFVALDIGCGMSFNNKPFIGENSIDMRYVDPLAFFYNKIAEKKKLHIPRVEFAFVEYLTAFYDRESVSFIIIQNALDHSFNPVKGIRECISILKKGGILYLAHRKNEAEYENYKGFHQNNIDVRNGNLVIWNKDYCEDINKMLSDIANVEIIEKEDMVFVKIIKNSYSTGFPVDSKDYGVLCKQLLYTICRLSDTKFVLSYHFNKIFQYPYFFVSSMFSSEFKAKIKHILRKIRPR